MNFLNKLRNQPKYIRKIILWSIVIVVALILAGLWIYLSRKSVRDFNKENFWGNINIPEQIKNIPNSTTD